LDDGTSNNRGRRKSEGVGRGHSAAGSSINRGGIRGEGRLKTRIGEEGPFSGYKYKTEEER